jgi:protein-tyrosine-phosphatase/DNA-binding transcriptional ArsR family regulator
MSSEQGGALQRRAAIHAALGDPHRLAIVDALSLSDLAPSELRELTGLESNLLAHHLDVLEDAGVIGRSASHGDRRRRYLGLHREALTSIAQPLRFAASNVVFVCTANSARSQLAAAMWNRDHDVPAVSAGTEPADRVHPQARRAARRRGLDLAAARPTPLAAIRPTPDLIVTVCDRAHEQLRRRSMPSRRTLHWSIADPAERNTRGAFDDAADELERRITALAPLVVAR